MKRIVLILSLLLLIFVWSSTSYALTGLGFGIRGGFASYKGELFDDDLMKLLPDAKDLGGAPMFGAHIHIGTLPIIDLELAAEYYAKVISLNK